MSLEGIEYHLLKMHHPDLPIINNKEHLSNVLEGAGDFNLITLHEYWHENYITNHGTDWYWYCREGHTHP